MTDESVTPPKPPKKKQLHPNAARAKREHKAWRQKTFIDSLRAHGTDSFAMEAADIGRTALIEWKKEPEFAAKYKEAQDFVTDILKRSGFARATVGVERPIYQGGKKVGTERVYSDRCWEILLKGRDKTFRGLDDRGQVEILRAIDDIVAKVQAIINKALPQTCPHCKNLLGLREEVVKELTRICEAMGTPQQ